ncbi:MAG: VWA domain-containing protein [Nitriliruptoraceae bacterium]|nr:VWA domain-containing protein [Nitriliruptoraceae bacterium]
MIPTPVSDVDLAEVAGRFGFLLHAAGIPVSPERSGRFADAVALAVPAGLDGLYWLARVTLLSDHGQVAVFDRVFQQVFGGLVDLADHRGDRPEDPPPVHTRPGERRPGGDQDEHTRSASARPSPVPMTGRGDDDGPEQETILAAVSADERLRERDFASLDAAELRHLRRMLAELRFAPPPRRVRRTRRDRRGRRIDRRATLARAHRTAGEPVVTVRRRHRIRPRRLVLICDISGSMEPYARAYLQLLHAAVGATRAEAFVFATRLTRLTRSLQLRSPDQALRQAGRAAPDWSGGTRIAPAIAEFLDRYGRRGLARGAVVVIVSDGWEHGDPAELGEQMARLARLAHRVVWINPRAASPRFAPLVGGMAAAMPHIDAFVSGHSVAALDEVIDAIHA